MSGSKRSAPPPANPPAGPPAGPPANGSTPPNGGAPPERPGSLLSKVASAVVMYHDARGLHAEQYRACRTNLTALNRGGAPWAVVVTSSKKGEGKSITAANVAACLAEQPGSRVCLVDTDFRAPSQAGLLGVENEPGITELMLDLSSLNEVIRRTAIAGLDVLPTGAEARNPAELIGSERFGNLLNELKHRYTWILIDTPPVNPYTDACVLAARCNGALLVVRMEETSRELVQRSFHAITRAGGKVLGTFLTGLPPDREDADRLGYYRAEAGDREVARQELARLKARREAERRLRDQEKAYIEQQKAEDKRKAPDEEPEV